MPGAVWCCVSLRGVAMCDLILPGSLERQPPPSSPGLFLFLECQSQEPSRCAQLMQLVVRRPGHGAGVRSSGSWLCADHAARRPARRLAAKLSAGSGASRLVCAPASSLLAADAFVAMSVDFLQGWPRNKRCLCSARLLLCHVFGVRAAPSSGFLACGLYCSVSLAAWEVYMPLSSARDSGTVYLAVGARPCGGGAGNR